MGSRRAPTSRPTSPVMEQRAEKPSGLDAVGGGSAPWLLALPCPRASNRDPPSCPQISGLNARTDGDCRRGCGGFRVVLLNNELASSPHTQPPRGGNRSARKRKTTSLRAPLVTTLPGRATRFPLPDLCIFYLFAPAGIFVKVTGLLKLSEPLILVGKADLPTDLPPRPAAIVSKDCRLLGRPSKRVQLDGLRGCVSSTRTAKIRISFSCFLSSKKSDSCACSNCVSHAAKIVID